MDLISCLINNLNDHGIAIFHFACPYKNTWIKFSYRLWEAKAMMTQNWYWYEVVTNGICKDSTNRITTTALLIFRKWEECAKVQPEELHFSKILLLEHENQKKKLSMLSEGEDGFALTKADWKQTKNVAWFATCLSFANQTGFFPMECKTSL